MSDVLGYVVVQWSSLNAEFVGEELYGPDDFGLSVAHEAARMLGASGGRFTVHKVMAEEIKEAGPVDACSATLTHRHGVVECGLLAGHGKPHQSFCSSCAGLVPDNVSWTEMQEVWS